MQQWEFYSCMFSSSLIYNGESIDIRKLRDTFAPQKSDGKTLYEYLTGSVRLDGKWCLWL